MAGVSAYFNSSLAVGTTSPRSQFEAVGNGLFSSAPTGSSLVMDVTGLPASNNWSNIRLKAGSDGGAGYLTSKIDNWGGYFNWVHNAGGSEIEVMRIDASNDRVGIGTTTPQAKLAVNGDIFAKKIKVTQSGWPDYVFHSAYQLPSLQEVEAYIKQNQHLPGVTSAAQVEREGLDVGENQAALLKKVEELTLYVIELNKQLAKQQSETNDLKDEVRELKTLLQKRN